MPRLAYRWALALAAALGLLSPRPSVARPYTVEDLLRIETVLGIEATPDGQWLVAQIYRGQGSAGRYGDDAWPQPETSELLRVDLRGGGAATPMFRREAKTGYLPGPISPRGDRMVVYRLQDRTWRAGIYTFDNASTVWLNAAPEIANYGRFVQWTDDRHIAMVVRADGAAPERVGFSWQVRERREAAWAATAKGEAPAFRLMGSGRFLQWGRPAPAHRFELWEADRLTPKVLASGDVLDLQVSPDGRYAALLQEEEAIQTPPTATVAVGTPSRRRNVHLVDLATGAIRIPCPSCDLWTHLLSWSATSDELLVYAGAAPGGPGLLRMNALDGRAVRAEAPNVTPRRLARPESIPYVRAGWIGDDPLIFGQHADAPDDRSDWYRLTPAGPVNLTANVSAPAAKLSFAGGTDALLDGREGVWRLGPSDKAVLVAEGAHVVPLRRLGEGIRFGQNPDPSAEPVVVQSQAGVARLDSKEWRLPGSGELLWTDGVSSVVRTTDDHGVGALALERPGASARRLLVLNAFLSDVEPAVQKAVHYEVDGRKLTGWLYLPPGSPTGRLPLVVTPYPGFVYDKPRQVLAPDGLDIATGTQILVGAGFAVLAPSTPQEKTSSNWSDGLTPAVLAATDAAIATGAIDPARLSLLGHSGGGYAVLVAASRTHRFRAVVAENGPSNLLADWGAVNPLFPDDPTFSGVINLMPGWSYGGQGHVFADPWTAPERYQANSPFFSVDKIDAAVLLVSADHDFVQLSQSESMFSALYRLNRNAALLTFWGEGHVVSSPANLRLLYGSLIDWLRINLDIKPPIAGAALGQVARSDQRRAQASTVTH